ncbi:hypothetical protein KBW71_11565 [Hydrogenophaga aromaticivorans]|uniref:hypothetical protein n=1 Tax=Hydrogenophaga aromaticivorans TaxID=2610898 RepID=UPI001B389E31|nr:hypothetical protein [Hydrogenophaga aromaticivorans]MBQ0919075.1 hypothetical protein [Hydrogenophaga aromaticivorans]
MNRTRTLVARLALVALSTLALAACETNPAKPEPAKPVAAAPASTKSLVEMQYELDKAAMELETTRTMALIKFADQSGSDYAKGLVSGIINGGAQAPAAAPRQSFVQVAQQQQRHAAEIELRTEELKERNSLWNKGLQVFDRAVGYRMFSKGLDFQKYQLDQNNAQQRYTLDTVSNTSLSSQQAGYEFNSRIPYYFSLPAGSQGVAPVSATPAAGE